MKINLLNKPTPIEILDYEKQIGHELVLNERKPSLELPRFYVHFERSEIKEGCLLVGESGNGNTADEALQDYCKSISFTRLVINAGSFGGRKEFDVPLLVHTKKVALYY